MHYGSRFSPLLAAGVTALLVTAAPVTASPMGMADTACNGLTGCEMKFCHIRSQLEHARTHDNQRQVKGLEKALKEAQVHCTTASLSRDLQEKIADTRDDIADDQADLQEALADGKADKVRKYQQRLKEKQQELEALEQQQDALTP